MLAFAAARDSSSSKRHIKLSTRLQQSLIADPTTPAPRPPRAKKARVAASSSAAADAGELGELIQSWEPDAEASLRHIEASGAVSAEQRRAQIISQISCDQRARDALIQLYESVGMTGGGARWQRRRHFGKKSGTARGEVGTPLDNDDSIHWACECSPDIEHVGAADANVHWRSFDSEAASEENKGKLILPKHHDKKTGCTKSVHPTRPEELPADLRTEDKWIRYFAASAALGAYKTKMSLGR
ncbi:hypothetical protein JKP88DRAFT_349859 [Tribonema minus]|uniref:Uncharacterized protein n=1 Tax=Tribonema minus TaxID=303371 RepID=A0A835YTA4_9STRA|nr:hypothetical protein JKP88DRAFT_349859 [Tribonema minus]